MIIVYVSNWDEALKRREPVGYEVDAEDIETDKEGNLVLLKGGEIVSVWRDWDDAHLVQELRIVNGQGDVVVQEPLS